MLFKKAIIMICHPNAKINLGLNVTERRPDGYHNLETIFYPIPICDTLSVEIATEASSGSDRNIFPTQCNIITQECDDYILRTAGIDIDCPAEKNLIIKALRLLKKEFDIPRLQIDMYKQIPSGAGLGGGSSDAAYMMRTLNEMFHLQLSHPELEERAATLGADCAFFIRNEAVFATGIGNIFTPCDISLQGWTLVLVKPEVFVSTKEAYAGITPHHPDTSITDIILRPIEEWKETLKNDFEEGIFKLHPIVANIKEELYRLGADYAAMSGSGSSVFGLFRTPLNEIQLESTFGKHFWKQYTL